MMEVFAVFALLPLGLFSFFSRGRGTTAGFLNFLGMLAPVVASAFSGIAGRKSARSAEDREIEYRRQQAEQEEAQNRARFEAAQGSPQANMQRLGFNTRLSRLLGGFGGRGQTPGFILDAFDQSRVPQEYTPGAEFIAPPKPTGGGFWDYAGDLAGAASYFDTERYKQGRQGATGAAPTAPSAAPAAPNTLLPSSFRNRQYFGLETPDADEFLRRR